MAASHLLSALFEKQRAEGLSDIRLAERLGITRASVSYLKSGRRGPGQQTVGAILRQYPELLGYLLVDSGSAPVPVDEEEPLGKPA